jgi:tyrosyl-tRNA synthetase
VDKDIVPSSTIPRQGEPQDLSAIPSLEKKKSEMEKGVPAYELFFETGLCSSRGEARRLIEQGGAYINDRQVISFDETITASMADPDGLIHLRKGKKRHFLIVIR